MKLKFENNKIWPNFSKKFAKTTTNDGGHGWRRALSQYLWRHQSNLVPFVTATLFTFPACNWLPSVVCGIACCPMRLRESLEWLLEQNANEKVLKLAKENEEYKKENEEQSWQFCSHIRDSCLTKAQRVVGLQHGPVAVKLDFSFTAHGAIWPQESQAFVLIFSI